MKIITKNKIKQECWSLDYELIKWLNEHLKVFLEDSKTTIDLTFHKFIYKKKEYTQEQMIKRLIYITDELLKDYYDSNIVGKGGKLVDEMYDLLKLVHWCLWW